MKKPLISAAVIAVTAATALWASSDRLDIILSGNNVKRVWTEDLGHFGPSGTAEDGGYDLLTFQSADGSTLAEFSFDQISIINYVTALKDSPMGMTVSPHHRSATLSVTPRNPSTLYRVGMMPASMLGDEDPRYWPDVIYKYECQKLEKLAEESGYLLTDYTTKDVFYLSGPNTLTIYPSEIEWHYDMPGQDYIAYAYNGRITSSGMVMDNEPCIVPFKAKEVEYAEVSFDFTPDLKSNGATVYAECADAELPFLLFYLTPEEAENADDLDVLADSKIEIVEQALFTYGDGDWDNATFKKNGSVTKTGLKVNDEFYVMAVGCEYGQRNTVPVLSPKYTIPLPSETNKCTFSVTANPLSASEIELNIVPSDNETNYCVLMEKTSAISDMETWVADKLHMQAYTNQVVFANGTDDPHIFSGANVINSKKDVIEGVYMVQDTEYTFMVFGVDETGERTTAIYEFKYTPKLITTSLTFDIALDEYDMSSSWNRYLNVSVTPSDPNGKYVFDSVKKSSYYESMSDEEFISGWASMYGTNLTLYTGEQTKRLGFSNWGTWDVYYVFVFGYDGGATSELYMYEFDSGTGESKLVRGPGIGD